MKDRDIVLALERWYRQTLQWFQQRGIPWWRRSVAQSQWAIRTGWGDTPEHMRWFFVVMIVVLLGHVWHIGTQSLWLDEGATWAEITDKSFGRLFVELWSKDAAYPLYHLLLKSWVAIAGDSELVMRLPSAVATATASAVVSLAFGRQPQRGFALLLMATAPLVIWYAQDAKVYGLWLLWSAVLTVGSHKRWWWWLFLVTLPFVHRLGLLMVALLLIVPTYQYRDWRYQLGLFVAALSGAVAVLGIALSIRAKTIGSLPLQSPVSAVRDLLARFLTDRRWGDEIFGVTMFWWMLPLLLLLILGTRDTWKQYRTHRDVASMQLLLLAYVPVAVIVVSYGMTPFFDARYAIAAVPAWVILMVRGSWYALERITIRGRVFRYVRVGRILVLLAVVSNVVNVFEPQRGIYAGVPIKEEWRVVVGELAHRVTNDDLVVVHPAYALPLYRYYARVTPDPLPEATVFPHFSDGYRGGSTERMAEVEYQRRLFEAELNVAALGKHRAWLLIAPDHANQIDPPIDGVNPYGRVWLYFRYPQRTWPCGGVDRYGVSLMCQSYPSRYGTTEAPQPTKVLNAVFGEQVKLRGVTIRPLGSAFVPGGVVPVQLYWEAVAQPKQDYRVFVHLCQRCNDPPVAQQDGAPLDGYGEAGRMTTWQLGDPVHDERGVVLPADLAPGDYAIIVGVYDAQGNRLPVVTEKGGVLGTDRIIVDTVTVTP